jgi:putative ABC transport system ATP-binding protein/lipoprotein-releasing system ATP-binding protein
MAAGEFVAVVGRSGSGKTTLLSLLAGLTRPSQGTVELFGQDLATLNETALAKLRGGKIGFIFQFPSLLPTLTVLANASLPLRFAERPEPDRPRALLEQAGLGDRLHFFPHQLSAGESRRVAVARALVNRPCLVLADEPTGDLDPETELTILNVLLEAHQQGATLLLSTHNPALASQADRLIRLESGRLKL